MLVLQRKLNEKVIVNGQIIITVTAIGPDKVRLGFDAPDDVVIDRLEVHERKIAAADAGNPWEERIDGC